MEEKNKEREERQELLNKIKDSIKKENENKEQVVPTLNTGKNITQETEFDRDEIIKNVRENIDQEKVKKSNSLYELFSDVAKENKKANPVRKRNFTRRNIDLGNVYNK